MKFLKGILAFALFCAAVNSVMPYLVQPKLVDYEKIAFNIPDKKPSVFRQIKSILTVCTGEDQVTCRTQASALLAARNLPKNTGNGYALFVNTQFRDSTTTVTLTLSDDGDRTVWRRSASMDSRDGEKAAHNLRTALLWSFASEWTSANWRPGMPLKDAPLPLEP